MGGGFTYAGTNACAFIAQAILGSAPTILRAPPTQTAEAGAAVNLAVDSTGDPPPFYQWYFNGTNALSCTTSSLVLSSVRSSESGTYTVTVSDAFGAVTSAPVAVNVIPGVPRRPVPGVMVMGQPGSSWEVVCADSLSSAPNWATLGSVSLSGTPQYYFDLTQPLPPQRFYRAWQTADPVVLPVLDLHMVPAITVTGSIGNSVRVDAINRFGPIDGWVTLATVTLTNTSQLYFDVSAPGQPERLYRLVPSH